MTHRARAQRKRLSRLAAGRRCARHDPGARHRFVDAGRGPRSRGLSPDYFRRGHRRRSVVPVSGRCRSGAGAVRTASAGRPRPRPRRSPRAAGRSSVWRSCFVCSRGSSAAARPDSAAQSRHSQRHGVVHGRGWRVLWSSAVRRATLFLVATVAVAMVTPIVRAPRSCSLCCLIRSNGISPDWHRHRRSRCFRGLVSAGWRARRIVARYENTSRRALGELRGRWASAMVALAGYAASFLPAIYAQTDFWTSSPTFFFMRLGLLMTFAARCRLDSVRTPLNRDPAIRNRAVSRCLFTGFTWRWPTESSAPRFTVGCRSSRRSVAFLCVGSWTEG